MYVVLPEVLTEHYFYGSLEFPSCINASTFAVRGLIKLGTGHPPAECGIKTKDHKRRHHWDSFLFLGSKTSVDQKFFYFYIIIPIDIVAFI